MNAAQISRARAIAEESDDGQLIRQLCDALEAATTPPCASDFHKPRVAGTERGRFINRSKPGTPDQPVNYCRPCAESLASIGYFITDCE